MDQHLQPLQSRQIQQRRVWLLVAAAAILLWGSRAAVVLTDGWYASCQVVEQQREIRAADERMAAMQREVAYARTDEGGDVEAKRRFGVGPDDEIWITVDGVTPAQERPAPQSVADRFEGWLCDAGGRVVDRVRQVSEVLGYWIGVNPVDQCVAVPVIEEEPLAEEAASAEEAATGEEPADEAGADARVGEDEAAE
ncbi:MAG TPA: hypothetical protein DEP45_02995 [Armatimonadetes bacterium]|nr:hypothetical protein [Armatimonadota bacterium]